MATVAMRPPYGWLVMVEGPEKRKHWQVDEVSTIGLRGDIPIGEDRFRKDICATIVYDKRQRRFFISTNDDSMPLYVDGEFVSGRRELGARSDLQLGDRVMRFVAFCGDDFSW